MKKKIVGILLCTAMLLTACGSDNASTPAVSTAEGTPIATDTASSEAVTETSAVFADETEVTPLATTIDTTALADGTYAVSFVATDASTDNGTIQLNVTVYDYEHFSADAVENLKSGDTLVLNGESITINTIENNGDNIISINGGLEQDGCDLGKDDDGNYSELLMDIGRNYTAVGQITLPLSKDFVFTDDKDPQNQNIQYSAEELVTLLGNDNQYFDALTTSVTVENGVITALHRIFMP